MSILFGDHGSNRCRYGFGRRTDGGVRCLSGHTAYSLSKAAAFNMTQSLRALLAGQGATVHAVVLGPIDTDMNRGFNIPKASPESAARGIFEGLERDAEGEVPCALLCRPKPGHGSSFSWTAAS